MGWGFRKRIKIAPGLHINLSKSGISTSIGGRGFTYNSRGRVTASIPGTGIRYTHSLNARRTTTPNRAAVSASGRIDSASSVQLSKREQATQDFVQQVRNRTANALQQYFVSHGVYVRAEDLADAATLEDHQDFLETLSKEFESTTKAIRLGVDIGSISLAEKEKAMLAVYEIERKCAEARGEKGELSIAAASLIDAISSWPAAPSLAAPFILGMVGCGCLLFGFFVVGLVLLLATAIYGATVIQSFEKREAAASEAITAADAQFGSLVETQVSTLPDLHQPHDSSRKHGLTLAVVLAILAVAAAAYHPALQRAFNSAPANTPSTSPDNQTVPSQSTPQEAPVSAPQAATYQTSFDCGKAHSDSEHLICGDAELAADDVELAGLYQQAKAQTADPAAFKAHVRDQWNSREHTCHDKDCLVHWYADQKQWFTNLLNTPATQAASSPQPSTYQTSFDCTAPTFLDQKTICGNSDLATMDRQMANLYDQVAQHTTEPAKLQSDQRDWLAVRRDCSTNVDCLRQAYTQRIAQLQGQ